MEVVIASEASQFRHGRDRGIDVGPVLNAPTLNRTVPPPASVHNRLVHQRGAVQPAANLDAERRVEQHRRLLWIVTAILKLTTPTRCCRLGGTVKRHAGDLSQSAAQPIRQTDSRAAIAPIPSCSKNSIAAASPASPACSDCRIRICRAANRAGDPPGCGCRCLLGESFATRLRGRRECRAIRFPAAPASPCGRAPPKNRPRVRRPQSANARSFAPRRPAERHAMCASRFRQLPPPAEWPPVTFEACDHRHQPRRGPQGPADVVGIDQGRRHRRERGSRQSAAAQPIPQRPQHRIVLRGGRDHMIARAKPAMQGEVQAIGAASGENDLPRIAGADQPGNASRGPPPRSDRLPARPHKPRGRPRRRSRAETDPRPDRPTPAWANSWRHCRDRRGARRHGGVIASHGES